MHHDGAGGEYPVGSLQHPAHRRSVQGDGARHVPQPATDRVADAGASAEPDDGSLETVVDLGRGPGNQYGRPTRTVASAILGGSARGGQLVAASVTYKRKPGHLCDLV